MKGSTNKILTIAVVLLLVTNIALVVFMLTGRGKRIPKQANKPGTSEMLVKELGMSEQQQNDYKAMKEEHMKTIRPLFDSVRAAKTAFYNMVKQPEVSDSLLNVYGQRITEKQATIERLTFAHFKRVRAIFTAEQQPKFDEFIQKMMQRKKDSASKKENH